MRKTKKSFLSCLALGLLSCTLLAGCGTGQNTPDGSTSNLASIAVSKNPDKMDYAVGEDFDPTGMQVTASYYDETSKVVDDYRLFGDKNLQLGARVTVIYVEGIRKTTQLKVNVVAKNIVDYEITKPTVNDYIAGELFEPAGLKVFAVYEDGSKAEISTFEILTDVVPESGDIQIKITEKLTRTYKVNVKEGVTVSKLTVEGFEEKYLPGAILGEGIVVTAHYSDNTSRVVRGWTLSKNKVDQGDTSVTVNYLNASLVVPFSVIKDERQFFAIEGESAIIASTKDMRKTANGADKNSANIGNSLLLPKDSYNGLGYLSNFACNDYTLTYKFNASADGAAVIGFNAIGSGAINTMFKKVTLNGNALTLKNNELTNGKTFTTIEAADANVVKGENVLVFNCASGKTFAIDQLLVKFGGTITPVCQEQHEKGEWKVLTAPTPTTAGVIYKVCAICKHVEKVNVPALGTTGLVAGSKVAPTNVMNGYTPYTYTNNGTTYKFNLAGEPALTPTTRTYFDFCSEKVDVELYERFPGAFYVNDEAKAKITNGLPTAYNAKAGTSVNGNAISPQSNKNEVGTGTWNIKINSDVAGSAKIMISASTHIKLTFEFSDCMAITVNGEAYVIDNRIGIGDSFFDFRDLLLADVTLKEGVNEISFKLTSKFPNLDGLAVVSSTAISRVGA